MIIDRIDPRSVRSAIELASHAPSVHNTQPWHWTIGRRVVHLNADRHRRLPATDADGRDLTVSCGAALHHVGVALAAAGIRTTVHRIPDPAEPERLATLELKPGTASEGDLEMAAAITRRRSDRRPFGDRPIPEETWLQVQNAAIGQGAILRPVVGPRARSALLEAIRQAAALQQDVPGYRRSSRAGAGTTPATTVCPPRTCCATCGGCGGCAGRAPLRPRRHRPGSGAPGGRRDARGVGHCLRRHPVPTARR